MRTSDLISRTLLPKSASSALEADEKREQAKQAFLDALEKNPLLMMTTAGSSFEGWRVTEYRGTLSTDAVVGAGLPAEADAIVSDLTDQRSLLLGSKMERAKRIAWNELLFRAHEAGANGILAIRLRRVHAAERTFRRLGHWHGGSHRAAGAS
ncbi:MAG: heavy metal-binding domain-containing protein [Adlercreutzia equolifaciens]